MFASAKASCQEQSKRAPIHLERRLKLWQDGDVEVLLQEGRYIQKHLVSSGNQAPDPEKTAQISVA